MKRHCFRGRKGNYVLAMKSRPKKASCSIENFSFIVQPARACTVNSLIATTSRKRPPPVVDHLVNNRFVSQLNTVSRAHPKFLRDRGHFFWPEITRILILLFSVSGKRPPNKITYDRLKIITQKWQKFSFDDASLDCWKITTVYR